MRIPPYLAGIVAGLLAMFATWAALFAAQSDYIGAESRWLHDMLAAKREIVEGTRHPLVLVAGGSGALFNVRAELLGERLDVRVVNVATYAGIGVTGVLSTTRSLARRGDIVLLSLEYELYSEHLGTSASGPFRVEQLPWIRHADTMLHASLGRVLEPWTDRIEMPPRDPMNVYDAPAHLDAAGDTLGNNAVLKNAGLREKVAELAPPQIGLTPDSEAQLRSFASWARANGVRVIATHANVPDFPGYYTRPDVVSAFERIDALHEALGMPFVDRWQDDVYPKESFFDTIYHLDSVAARIRTERLARALQGHIAPAVYGPAVRWPASSHPLAQLARDFHGWSPLSGFGGLEGPYPQWGLGRVIWALNPESAMLVQRDHAGRARVSAQVRASQPGQELDLLVNGERAAHASFADSTRFEPFSAEVELRAGDNVVTLVHHGAQRQALLIERWTYDPVP